MLSSEDEANVLQPPLRAGKAYEDIADALQAGRKRGVVEDVATRVSEQVGIELFYLTYTSLLFALGKRTKISRTHLVSSETPTSKL